MHYGSSHSVAQAPESLSVFSHLDFRDRMPSLHTAGLFSYENLRKSANARVLKYSRRTISGREVYLGHGSVYHHPGLIQFNPSFSADIQGLPAWKYLEHLQNTAKSSWYLAERITVVSLTSLALFGILIYFLKLYYAIRLLSRGVPFWTVISLLNPFTPFIRTLRQFRGDLETLTPSNPPATAPPNSSIDVIDVNLALSERTFSATQYPTLN